MKSFAFMFVFLQLFFAISSFSAVTDFFTDETIKDFEKGEFKNISLDRNGYLSLSPNTKEVFKKDDILFVWTIAQDSDGNTYFGTGNKPRIYRETAEGKVELYYESEIGTSINAIKIDKQNNLYASVNPIGKIVKIKANGITEDYAHIKESYIWDLELDSKGKLYVATGKSAAIYEVRGKDQVEKIYTANEDSHFLCMAINKKDELYFGSEGKGNLYKMNIKTRDAKVLFDTFENEIKDIAIDKIGNVYFATATKIAKKPPRTFDYTDTFVLYGAMSQRIKKKKGRRLIKKITLKNSVYKIDTQGEVKKLITRDEETFLALDVDENGIVYAGSGDNGIIYKINSVNNATIFVDSNELQILSLISKKGNIIASTGNLGKLLKIGLSFSDNGVYTSKVFDAKGKAHWGKISWDCEDDPNKKVYLQTRSGNTLAPDKTWTSWSQPYKNDEGEVVQSEAAQYIQYRVTIPSSAKESPLLKKVIIAYLLENRPPQVEKLQLKKENTKRLVLDGPFNKILKPSVYSLSWLAMDMDKDYLTYSIYYRDELTDQFILLKEGIHKKKYSFDSRRIPDGTYIFRVVASDEKSNGVDRAKTGHIDSTVFKIDNTPPSVQDVDIQRSMQGYVVKGKAKDDLSIIKVIQYSVNGQDWIYLPPRDMIYDSKEEAFEFRINTIKVPLLKGKNSIIFRVADSFDNFTTQEVRFQNNKPME